MVDNRIEFNSIGTNQIMLRSIILLQSSSALYISATYACFSFYGTVQLSPIQPLFS